MPKKAVLLNKPRWIIVLKFCHDKTEVIMTHADTVSHRLQLSGLHCASCVKTIETTLAKQLGVYDVSVNFADRTALVTAQSELDVNDLLKAVKKAGYGASLFAEAKTGQVNEVKQQAAKTSVALIAGIILIALAMGHFMPSLQTARGWIVNVALLLSSLAIMAYSGGHYFSNAIKAAARNTATMDSLIALGTGAAWIYSAIVIMAPYLIPSAAQVLYLDTAVVVIALVNLGNLLELLARHNTASAIEKLMNLQPKMVRVLRNDEEVLIRAVELQAGDLIRLRPGERVPVDSIIVEGHSRIDEAMLTGEPMPKDKQVGDHVIGGTANQSGTLLIRAERVGKDTVLAGIISMIQKAQNSKPKLAKLADRIAAIFVPVVLLLATATAIGWYLVGPEPKLAYMLFTTMAVLVIACPCALGLAVPIAVIAGAGKAAENGILIRNIELLQKLQTITTVVLDKTGTITEGKPFLTKWLPYVGFNEIESLQLAASVERMSEHPFAAAIVTAAKAKQINTLPVLEFQAKPGLGVSGVVDGKTIQIGNRQFMQNLGVNLIVAMEAETAITSEGASCNYVAINNQLAAVYAITDPIKADSKSAVSRLQQRGLKVMMITGDDIATAQNIANQVGITEIYANTMPHDKAERIAELQAKGEVVLMVGDGINDAPALARANASLAMASGTDIAIDSADGVLTRSSLNGIHDALVIAQATVRNMKQNLFGAFIYNMIAIPIAAGVLFPLTDWLLNPMIAGFTMALSSVTVVLNANRLRLLKLK